MNKVSLREYLLALRIPGALFVVNFLLLTVVLNLKVPIEEADIATHIFRIAIYIYVGWLVVSNDLGGLGVAAFTGILALFFDHVLLSTVYFFALIIVGEELQYHEIGSAIVGVSISFLLFVPAAMLLTFVGGAMKLLLRKLHGDIREAEH